MYAEEQEPEPNGLEFSILDQTNIEDLEIDDFYQSETGEFSVQRINLGFRVNTKRGSFGFTTLEETIEFLSQNS